MIRVLLLLISTLFLSCNTNEEEIKQKISDDKILSDFPVITKQAKHKALVLGTFHFDMATDGSDVKEGKKMDVLSKENKIHLDTIIRRLKKFNPTKIAIEWTSKMQVKRDSQYLEYKAGNFDLPRNETFQIGFRLAKELGHEKLYCIDNRPVMPEAIGEIEDIDKFADSLGQSEAFHRYDQENRRFINYSSEIQKNYELLDVIKLYNSEVYTKRSKQLWTTGMVNLGVYHDYAGTDLTGYWFERNTRIFANAANLVEDEEERILIIYGAAHKWILDELFDNTPEFDLLQFNKL
ncbi:hypothetical protein GTQ40_06820 [Flavobacteriaceae bacterium R38]|nr:hypothetical protein [Flavobacteriaceae bacterium R38]